MEEIFYSNVNGKQILEERFEASKKNKKVLSLLLLEVDNIQKIEDEMIIEILNMLKNFIQNDEFIYRFSSESFIMVFSDKDLSEVLETGNKIIKRINSLDISITGAVEVLNELEENIDYLIDNLKNRLEKGGIKEKNKIYIEDIESLNIGKNNILILDEDKVLVKILSTRYRNKGFNVFPIKDVEYIDKTISENSIDLILSNYLISGIKVTEIIRNLKNKYRSIKILIYSSLKSETVVEEVLSFGGDDYIEKPFSPIELDARVKKLMEKW